MINTKDIDIAAYQISNAFMFRGSYKGFPSDAESGDIICNEDNEIYAYFDNEWHKIESVESVGAESSVETIQISRKIVTHCKCCNGPLPWLSAEDMKRGYVKCSYCGSMISIYEDEDKSNE